MLFLLSNISICCLKHFNCLFQINCYYLFNHNLMQLYIYIKNYQFYIKFQICIKWSNLGFVLCQYNCFSSLKYNQVYQIFAWRNQFEYFYFAHQLLCCFDPKQRLKSNMLFHPTRCNRNLSFVKIHSEL